MFWYRRYGCVVLAVSFALCLPAPLVAADRPVPVAYDLAVTISPVPGSIAVRGKIEVPVESPHAREIQFALHETFAIKQLLVNGQKASFSFKPAEPSPIYPATRNVLVSLPFDIQQREIRIDLEYGGHLKDIPEFGTFPGQKRHSTIRSTRNLNFGAGQGDWINEAFAEYFSAFAVEKVFSEEQFRTVLENYRKQVQELPANAPSLSTVPFDGSFFVIRYYKSSLLLDYMRHALGDDKFFRASRDFFRTYSGKSIGTTEFRVYWKQRLGDQKDSLDVWLDSAGGLPELVQKRVIGHANGASLCNRLP